MFRFLAFAAILFAAVSAHAADKPYIEGIFYDDNGESCIVFVAVDADRMEATGNPYETLARVILENRQQVCDFTPPSEVVAISITDLDQYNQPDWSTLVEHGSYAVEEGFRPIELCQDTDDPKVCAGEIEGLMTPVE